MGGNLTVVIPVYNREVELQRCLDSIAAQTVRPAQVIVVDDGSTDNTAQIAREHPLTPLVFNGPHLGAPAARNLGLEKVITEWTMFFDSDDTMEPDHIAAACAAIGPDTDIIGWNVRLVLPDGQARILPFEPTDTVWHNIMHGTLATQRYIARTEFFRRAGGWNPTVRVWNDIELGARLLKLKPHIVKIKGIRVNQYRTAESITGTSWTANLDKYSGTFAAFEETLDDHEKEYISLKKTILAADIAREAHKANYPRPSLPFNYPHTLKYRFAYRYRLMGGRGVARVMRWLFR